MALGKVRAFFARSYITFTKTKHSNLRPFLLVSLVLTLYFTATSWRLRVPERQQIREIDPLVSQRRQLDEEAEKKNTVTDVKYDELLRLLVSQHKPNPVCTIQIQFHSDVLDKETLPTAVLNKDTRGLFFESMPLNYKALLKNNNAYADRILLLNAAVSGHNASGMPYYFVNERRIREEFPNAPQDWFIDREVSFNRGHIEKLFNKFTQKWTPKEKIIKTYIAVKKIRTVSVEDAIKLLHTTFKQCNHQLHLLQLNAEGFDWTLTRRFLRKVMPDVIVFRRGFHSNAALIDAEQSLTNLKYKTWSKDNNLFAVRIGRLNVQQ